MQIRPATATDLDALEALWRPIFPEYFDPAKPHRAARASIERKLAWGDGLFWVAVDDALVGSLMGGYDGHRGWLYSLCVAPERRREGVATLLVQEATRTLRQLGCPKINIQVLQGNARAQRFWTEAGFTPDDVRCYGFSLSE